MLKFKIKYSFYKLQYLLIVKISFTGILPVEASNWSKMNEYVFGWTSLWEI